MKKLEVLWFIVSTVVATANLALKIIDKRDACSGSERPPEEPMYY